MDSECQQRLYDDYFESVYRHANILTDAQFHRVAEQFDLLYRDVLPPGRDAAILDFGCGTGQFLFYLKKIGYRNCLGIDRSAQQVAYCKKHVHENVIVVDGLKFLKGRRDEFDVIAAHDVLEHFPKDRTLVFLERTRQALKPGGLLILRVPNMSNPLSLASRYNDFTHEAGFTAVSLAQLLTTAGFAGIRLLPQKIVVRSFRNLGKKLARAFIHRAIRFVYYVLDYNVPENLDKNLVVAAQKEKGAEP